jgi:hypothetical protein
MLTAFTPACKAEIKHNYFYEQGISFSQQIFIRGGGGEQKKSLNFPLVPRSHITNGSPHDEISETLKNAFHLPTYT